MPELGFEPKALTNFLVYKNYLYLFLQNKIFLSSIFNTFLV